MAYMIIHQNSCMVPLIIESAYNLARWGGVGWGGEM